MTGSGLVAAPAALATNVLKRATPSRLAPLLAVIALVTVACAGSSSSGSSRPQPAGVTPQGPSGGATLCTIRTSTVERDTSGGPGISFLKTAQVDQDDCYDIVRFEFISGDRDLPPPYVAEYQPGPFNDFNQLAQIKVGGSAYLVLRFGHTATQYLSKTTYQSRESITPSGMHHLQETRLVAGQEGEVEVVIGLDSQRPSRSQRPASAPRHRANRLVANAHDLDYVLEATLPDARAPTPDGCTSVRHLPERGLA